MTELGKECRSGSATRAYLYAILKPTETDPRTVRNCRGCLRNFETENPQERFCSTACEQKRKEESESREVIVKVDQEVWAVLGYSVEQVNSQLVRTVLKKVAEGIKRRREQVK